MSGILARCCLLVVVLSGSQASADPSLPDAAHKDLSAAVRDLASSRFEVREKATILLRSARGADATLLQAAEESADPEVVRRANAILAERRASVAKSPRVPLARAQELAEKWQLDRLIETLVVHGERVNRDTVGFLPRFAEQLASRASEAAGKRVRLKPVRHDAWLTDKAPFRIFGPGASEAALQKASQSSFVGDGLDRVGTTPAVSIIAQGPTQFVLGIDGQDRRTAPLVLSDDTIGSMADLSALVFVNGDINDLPFPDSAPSDPNKFHTVHESVVICTGSISRLMAVDSVVIVGGECAALGGRDSTVLVGGGYPNGDNPRERDWHKGARLVVRPNERGFWGQLDLYDASKVGLDLTAKDKVVTVRRVDPGKCFDKAGVKVGDRVVSIDGRPVESVIDVNRGLCRASVRSGDAVLKVSRNGRNVYLQGFLPD